MKSRRLSYATGVFSVIVAEIDFVPFGALAAAVALVELLELLELLAVPLVLALFAEKSIDLITTPDAFA